MNNLVTIEGVRGYLDSEGNAMLNLEDTARGLGFTRIANSGNEVVMWSRVEGYLSDFGVHTCAHDDFIPENVFYRLAMKAKNTTAESFQAKVCDEILPTIRRTGSYQAVPKNFLEALECLVVKEKALLLAAPKAEYYDRLVDHGHLTNFRDTAKAIGVGQKVLMTFLEEHGYIYRDRNGKPKPYADRMEYFSIKDYAKGKSAGSQVFVTVKGKQRFAQEIA